MDDGTSTLNDLFVYGPGNCEIFGNGIACFYSGVNGTCVNNTNDTGFVVGDGSDNPFVILGNIGHMHGNDDSKYFSKPNRLSNFVYINVNSGTLCLLATIADLNAYKGKEPEIYVDNGAHLVIWLAKGERTYSNDLEYYSTKDEAVTALNDTSSTTAASGSLLEWLRDSGNSSKFTVQELP